MGLFSVNINDLVTASSKQVTPFKMEKGTDMRYQILKKTRKQKEDDWHLVFPALSHLLDDSTPTCQQLQWVWWVINTQYLPEHVSDHCSLHYGTGQLLCTHLLYLWHCFGLVLGLDLRLGFRVIVWVGSSG